MANERADTIDATMSSSSFSTSRRLDFSTVVVGGGTAGAVVAGLLAEASGQPVLVLEAGPDFGPHDDGGWPSDLMRADALGYSEAWGYDSGDTYPDRIVPFERAKVIGGCSSHNGCAAIWGSRLDYDGWAARGNPGWAADELRPLFQAAAERLRVRQPAADEMTPFQAACLDAVVSTGIPRTADLNDLDEDLGVAASPVNISQGRRWNTAFAYLDPVRDPSSKLTIRDRTVVDRLLVDGDRVTGVVAIGVDGPFIVGCDRVVIAAGTYESPAVLLRSGIGDPAELRAIGIAPVIPLPGVGRNLHDHPALIIDFAGSTELQQRMERFASERWMPEEQTIAKARSTHCQTGFDLHLYPVGGRDPDDREQWRWKLPVACLTPRSRGRVRLRSADPLASPAIDHRYLSDPDGADRAVLTDGVALAREVAAQPALRSLIGEERSPGPDVRGAAVARWIDANVVHYYHPVGTCAMGPADDPTAVVDSRGRIHGLTNAYVADCSIMPVIPRANTNIPAVVVGERIARWLLAG